MRELQTFSVTGTKLPWYVTITIIITGVPLIPLMIMDMAESFWINWSRYERNVADHRPLNKTPIKF